ncbi:Ribosome recycling factor [Mesomycoplasma conjunctivae]|uniref:Ribosome recycling factor n=1 Tax=Mesomycoplasma conjunctivae (strain ATCC 25834 / NCTC 10147 / HRC/581) TaxID=572263 RepID=C5J7A9_MESCH|nr:ribosome-recycling factor [Mesomycoplasma conjunctivae]CAT05372.1 Ribosome recycling factor [Mesomycoplasma conjunctivae]VEU66598.1 Ribosome recycling factor [Mesomycoplasma conjunctivae]
MEVKKEIKFFTDLVDQKSLEVFDHLDKNFNKINIGRANPQIISHIRVDYYGAPTPINEIANISVPSALQLLVKPYDISLINSITSTLVAHKIEAQIQKEANQIRLVFPELTTEKRKELVKSIKKYEEEAKVKIRLIRQDVNKLIKKEDLSEDEEKNYLNQIQKTIDSKIKEIDKIFEEKSKLLLNI